MEEISETAKAYYANLSDRQKRLGKEFFQAMDTDGDGKITLEEYAQCIKEKKGFKTISSPDFFKKLDKDGNGTLDFDEFIIVHYICSTERVYFCDECKVFLAGVYFTCVQCFNGSGNTYDLCSSCYRDKNINHHKDALFLDNYTLLQAKRQQNKASGSQRKSGASEAIALVETTSNVVSSCIQM
ncbi:calcium ion binding protein, putative [Ricinus communis]|uniref:Calcium ion binding protein, putative n=2 Tax=Ricinus communis TaxID=3988 RepID=B9SQS2_RICCO|nr:calcium ion binding protein, putative [Ricinus communis]